MGFTHTSHTQNHYPTITSTHTPIITYTHPDTYTPDAIPGTEVKPAVTRKGQQQCCSTWHVYQSADDSMSKVRRTWSCMNMHARGGGRGEAGARFSWTSWRNDVCVAVVEMVHILFRFSMPFSPNWIVLLGKQLNQLFFCVVVIVTVTFTHNKREQEWS